MKVSTLMMDIIIILLVCMYSVNSQITIPLSRPSPMITDDTPSYVSDRKDIIITSIKSDGQVTREVRDTDYKTSTKDYYHMPAQKAYDDYPLDIKKSYQSANDFFYLKNDMNKELYIIVEIMSIKYEIGSVEIIETVDKNLEITNYSVCYILAGDSTNELIKYKEDFIYENHNSLKNPTINLTRVGNRTLYAKINKLDPKGRIVYRYKVKPKNEGLYDTSTIIRTKNHPDLDYPLKVDLRDSSPEFFVTLEVNKLEASFGDLIPIKYDIIYKGGFSNSCSINSINLDPEEEWFRYHGNTSFTNVSFNSTNPIFTIDGLYIEYPNEHLLGCLHPDYSIYRLPGLLIDNDPYRTNVQISINTWVYKYRDILIPILALIITLTITILVARKEIKGAKDELKSLVNSTNNIVYEIKNLKQNDPAKDKESDSKYNHEYHG
jgi:hypothetical protein